MTYKIIIDRQIYKTKTSEHTGASLLFLAKRVPVEQFGLYLKDLGQDPRRIVSTECVRLWIIGNIDL